jgi:hypothetical protein
VRLVGERKAGFPCATPTLGIDRKTIRKYVAPTEEAGFVPGGPPVTTEEWALYVRSWFPELVVPELRSATFPESTGLAAK